jgi:hypothetical protein
MYNQNSYQTKCLLILGFLNNSSYARAILIILTLKWIVKGGHIRTKSYLESCFLKRNKILLSGQSFAQAGYNILNTLLKPDEAEHYATLAWSR